MSSPRALIIDNNTTLAETVAEILCDSGFEVALASSGVEALVVWRRRPADLVVLDVDLPDIGGFALARRLLRRAAHCKLVVMSAGDPHRLAALCEQFGAAFLAKPFSPGHLIAAIRRIVQEEPERRPGAASTRRTARRLLGHCKPAALLQHSRRARGGRRS